MRPGSVAVDEVDEHKEATELC